MKRKLLQWVKQKVCRHQYEFVKCDCVQGIGLPNYYFLYRCEKCGKSKVIYTNKIAMELSGINPEKAIGYLNERLVIPEAFNQQRIFESREAGYLVSKYYNKYGIFLAAWGNREFGPKTDQDDLEMKSHDEMVKDKDRIDTLTLEESQFIMRRQEFKQSMERF